MENGLSNCEEALRLSPIPFDLAMTRSVRGYGRIKSGDTKGGMSELREALEWLERSHLRYQRARFALWLAEGHLREGDRVEACRVIDEVLEISRDFGYRRVEGEAERLLGESLILQDPAAAADHLTTAVQILEEIGAQNELAKALAARAELLRGARNFAAGRRLDEPLRIRAALGALGTKPTE